MLGKCSPAESLPGPTTAVFPGGLGASLSLLSGSVLFCAPELVICPLWWDQCVFSVASAIGSGYFQTNRAQHGKMNSRHVVTETQLHEPEPSNSGSFLQAPDLVVTGQEGSWAFQWHVSY